MGRTLDVMKRIWVSRNGSFSGCNLARGPHSLYVRGRIWVLRGGSFSVCNLDRVPHTRCYGSDLAIAAVSGRNLARGSRTRCYGSDFGIAAVFWTYSSSWVAH